MIAPKPDLKLVVRDNPVNRLPLRDAALTYADHGWRVHPLKPCSKLPLIRSWQNRATTDRDQILAWWDKWPDANIGILTGEKSGILVVDIDPKNGGDESYEKLLRDRELPKTATQRTGSGGSHLFFRYPDEPVKTRRGFPDIGIDISSNRAYAVAAPSVHENGSLYAWVSDSLNLENIPSWLLDILLNKKQAVSTEGMIPVGMRNSELFRLGCALRGEGISARKIGTEIHTINKLQCETPLDDEEVNRIIDSVNQYIRGDRKPLFKYRDYIRSNEFPRDPTLRHILHVISFYMDENGKGAYPTQEQIAQDTGYNRETVSRRIEKAKTLGVIQVVKNQQPGQKYANNVYFLPRRFYGSV